MTITPFNANTYLTDRNTANLVSLKTKLDGLTTQLATGKASDSYGGLGAGRTTSLSAHATLSALDGYDSAISGATTRVKLTSASLTQVATLGEQVQRILNATSNPSSANIGQVARNNLEAALDALNQEAGGRYVFGGRATDAAPVASSALILDGDPATQRDGLKTLIAEQKAADLGPAGNGRVTASASGRRVTVSEDGAGAAGTEARANFGFKIVSAQSSNAAALTVATTPQITPDVTFSLGKPPQEGDRIRVAVNQPDGGQTFVDLTAKAGAAADAPDTIPVFGTAAEAARFLSDKFKGVAVASAQGAAGLGLTADFGAGAPASATIDVASPPAAGDTVTLTLALRDGTTQALTLTARASADATSATEFSLSGDVAANLSTAISNALKGAAASTLPAASAIRASQDFFAGSKSAGLAPRRVSGDGNGYAEQASANTVIWYTGDDTSADPRATATVQAGANRKLDVGAQANEAPLRSVLAGLASVAAESFTNFASGTSESHRYAALSQRSQTLLGASNGENGIEAIASDISLAASNLADATSQNRAARAALQDSLDGIDTISTEAVTANLLALQTQLQASYQVTSLLSKLSLVNYLN